MMKTYLGAVAFLSAAALGSADPTNTEPLAISEVVQDRLADEANEPQKSSFEVTWQHSAEETLLDGDVVEGNMSDEYIELTPQQPTHVAEEPPAAPAEEAQPMLPVMR